MADRRLRDATHSWYPYVRMLQRLVDRGAFTPAEIVTIPENTVIKGYLVDFLLDALGLHRQFALFVTGADVATARRFFESLPLATPQRQHAKAILREAFASIPVDTDVRAPTTQHQAIASTISVVTPSFEQAEFLGVRLTPCATNRLPRSNTSSSILDPLTAAA